MVDHHGVASGEGDLVVHPHQHDLLGAAHLDHRTTTAGAHQTALAVQHHLGVVGGDYDLAMLAVLVDVGLVIDHQDHLVVDDVALRLPLAVLIGGPPPLAHGMGASGTRVDLVGGRLLHPTADDQGTEQRSAAHESKNSTTHELPHSKNR